MHGSPQRVVSSTPLAMYAANADIAVQLSAAAVDGDHPRVKELLTDLLRCQTRRTDEDLSPLLKALGDLFLLLQSMAVTDELTGLHNRRGFLRRGARFLEMAVRTLQCVQLIYIDVDHLKYLNDSLGHDAGDGLLRRTAQVLRDVWGTHAVIGRLGGDEFAVLDTSISIGGRKQILRRVQDAVNACNASAAVPQLSLSVGCVEFDPRKPTSILTLLATADRAMYRHKARAFRRFDYSLQTGQLPLEM